MVSKATSGTFVPRTLRLDLPPKWEAIDHARESVIAFLRQGEEQPAVIDSIAMVVSELAENAVKYGRFNSGDEVHIGVDAGDGAITVEVKNPTSSDDMTQLNRLDRTIQWIRGYQDPFEAYLTRLKEVLLQSPENPESGLGLVRIAYEGESSLDFYLGETATLSVSAVYQR
jgi:hypothetical protein